VARPKVLGLFRSERIIDVAPGAHRYGRDGGTSRQSRKCCTTSDVGGYRFVRHDRAVHASRVYPREREWSGLVVVTGSTLPDRAQFSSSVLS
jgi:hypothetical protein